ncbi:MAG: 2-isopropylmalate synthase [Lachnospiraceae bacterium]|nr:2-isopropylmalate synthase [Lachnospiraceae bacterium]
MQNVDRYKRFPVINYPERRWPSKLITKAPEWCSVDLRDGNQALVDPMTVDEKKQLFKLLCDMGFRQIEVGFPAASSAEREFVRVLAEEGIPEGVYVQVLSQCREEQLVETFEAIRGIPRVILHIYNPTSVLQREVVFGLSKEEIRDIPVRATRKVRELAESFEGELILEYSPESFTGTETDYALDVCNAVLDVWEPCEERRAIINLPATVEMNTPNVFADQVEWLSDRLKYREFVTVSVHTHNDRGTGIAETELALLAGAERVEGTLFGNGERTGNMDVITLAYNLYAVGIDPGLSLSDIDSILESYEELVKMPVSPRHPYAGRFAFTAFSGGHQDAISKGFAAMAAHPEDRTWRVPYLLIDPADIGRTYETVVRINAQSGKGGAAYILRDYYGFHLPKAMHPEFGARVQRMAETLGGELTREDVFELFRREYLERKSPLHFLRCSVDDRTDTEDAFTTHAHLVYTYDGKEAELDCFGNGPIDAVKKGLENDLGLSIRILDYTEHALHSGSEAQAAAYVHMEDAVTGRKTFGVGISSNITRASIRAMFCAVNRLKDGGTSA